MEAFDTTRLRLRPLDDGDEALYRRIYTDPLVMRHVAAPLCSAEARTSFAIACRQNTARRGREWWTCIKRDDDRAIGILGTTRHEDAIEIGVLLLPDWQRRGFAAEAMAVVIGRIAQRQPAAMLRLRHATGNAAMSRLASRLGFAPEAGDGTEVRWRWRGNGDPAAATGGRLCNGA